MMLLPEFLDPEPTAEQLRFEQQRLHDKADKMLEQIGLLATLTKYGRLEPVGGSYAYGLMAYPDIDLAVIDDHITTSKFADIVAGFVDNNHVRKVSTANNVDFQSPRTDRPKGYWLGLEIPFENERWGVDCWIQKSDWVSTDIDRYASAFKNIGERERDAILRIKYQLIYRGLYGKVYTSADVYNAVIDHGTLTTEDFLSYQSE